MGILEKIKSVEKANELHLKVLLWGESGSGKSTFCSTGVGPIIYCYTERQGAQAFLRGAQEGVDKIVHVESVKDLQELLKFLRSDKEFNTVCLDSFTEMQLLFIDHILGVKVRDPGERMTLDMWGRLHNSSKKMAREFRRLQKHVVITCLAETAIIGPEGAQKMVMQPMLSGKKLGPQLSQFFNVVGFIYRSTDKESPEHKVMLTPSRKIKNVKGVPGLRHHEDPDMTYWIDRCFNGAEARDPEAPMFPEPTFGRG